MTFLNSWHKILIFIGLDCFEGELLFIVEIRSVVNLFIVCDGAFMVNLFSLYKGVGVLFCCIETRKLGLVKGDDT